MAEISFSNAELARYSRHLIIPEFNIEGQRKLKAAKVLVVGTGGLGAPLLQYLTAAGVGTIGVLDFDIVDDSNLQRQVLFAVSDVGKPKVEAAIARLQAQNPFVHFIAHNVRLSAENALEIIAQYDLVADGTDNFPTRYLVNDACVLLGKTNVYASIFRFEGQASVFNYKDASGAWGPNYRDLFPEPPPAGLVPSCAEGGVIGVLPGILGSIQANEVIKVITGVGETLSGRLFLLDGASFETRTLQVVKDAANPLTGVHPTQTSLIDYDQFCNIPSHVAPADLQEITPLELARLRDLQVDFQLIDVREPHEYAISNLGGELIPLSTIAENAAKIRLDKQVVVHCKGGKRSAQAIQILETQFGFRNLYNLKGGILAFADEVDGSLAKY
jgi:sulfur-carrier protein adenylyltransferase/sulfurtransferase